MAHSVSANKPGFAEETGNSEKKRRAILEAAMSVFLKSGYLGASMDEIAALAQVSKQTVYKQFSNKESLFVEIVTSMTDTASDAVHNDIPELTDSEPGCGIPSVVRLATADCSSYAVINAVAPSGDW